MDGLHQLEVVILLLGVVLRPHYFSHKNCRSVSYSAGHRDWFLGLVPGLPVVTLRPDLVFLVFLPPILWAAAYFTSWRNFATTSVRFRCWQLDSYLVTTAAGVRGATLLPGMEWAEAIALGACLASRCGVRHGDCEMAATSLGGSSRFLRERVWSTMPQR
jgi:CPA1 family monovalent cation:H+ antiporter